MSYFVYKKPRMSRKQHLILTGIVCCVAIIVTSCVVRTTHLKQIGDLQAKIDAQKNQIAYYEEVKKEYEFIKPEVEKIKEYKSDITNKVVQIETLSQQKEELAYHTGELENTIKKFAEVGTRPQNFYLSEPISRGSWDRHRENMEYVGEWLGTFYSPTAEECSNTKGITASGEPIVPGKTIAIDPIYWDLGTRFYIEGIGEVVATDTGSEVKGRNRFDFAVFNTGIAHSGSFTANVYLIKD